MKKLTASIVASALMISAMGINAFAADTAAPKIAVYGNGIATASGKDTVVNVRMSDFKDVAGMDVKITGTGVTLGTPESSELTLEKDVNYVKNDGEIHIVELNKSETVNIKVPVTVSGYDNGKVEVTYSKLAADGKKLLTEKAEYTVDNTNGTVAAMPEEKSSNDGLADSENTFIPYGSVYTGKDDFVLKDANGKFAATTGAKYTEFQKPANNILTYGASENTKADGTNTNLQFGTYTDKGSTEQGTMLIVGDWNAYLEEQIKTKGYTAEQALQELYKKNAETGKKYAEASYGNGEMLLVYKVKRTTYLWRNEDGKTFEYAIRVKNYAGKECTAVGYYVENELPVFSGQLKSSKALG